MAEMPYCCCHDRAVMQSKPEAITLLLKAGANPGAPSYIDKEHRSSALHLAVVNGYESLLSVRNLQNLKLRWLREIGTRAWRRKLCICKLRTYWTSRN